MYITRTRKPEPGYLNLSNINKRRLQLRRDDLREYTCYIMSYKDIIHTYYLLIVMLKLGRSLFEHSLSRHGLETQ